MSRYFIALLALTTVLVGCQEETFLTSNDSTLFNIESKSSTNVITFDTNVTWTASSSDSWLTVTPSSGNPGTVTVTVTAAANNTYDSRTATVSVTAGELMKSFSFIQASNNGYILQETNFSVGSEGGSIRVPIQSNVDYDVTVEEKSQTWLSISQTKALSNNTIIITATKNDTYDSRRGVVYVSYEDSKAVINIEQSQLDELLVGTKSFEIGSEGGDVIVPIQSNVEYVAEVMGEATEWISISSAQTKGLEEFSLVLQVAKNLTYGDRVGQVKISGAGKESVVTVNQSQNDAVIVEQKEYNISSKSQTVVVNVKSNIDYSYSIQDSWIAEMTTRSLSSKDIEFSIEENAEFVPREGQIVFTSMDGTHTEVVIIRQDKYTPEYVLSQDSCKMVEGDTELVKVSLKNGEDPIEEFDWISDNSEVASVTCGEITAKLEGSATIKAIGKQSGLSVSCNVEVVKEYDVYIAYYYGQDDYSYYLKNGVEYQTPFEKSIWVNDIGFIDNHLYLLGSNAISVDGELETMPDGFRASRFCIDGEDVYIAGTAKIDGESVIRVLKNGVFWADLTTPYEEYMISVNDMHMEDDVLCVAADYTVRNAVDYCGQLPVYWKGTEYVIVHDTSNLSYSTQEEVVSVYVHKGNVYALWGQMGIGSECYVNINGVDEIVVSGSEPAKIVVDDSYIYLTAEVREKIGGQNVYVPYLWVYDVNSKQLIRKVNLNDSQYKTYNKTVYDMTVVNGVVHIVGTTNVDLRGGYVGIYWKVDGEEVTIERTRYLETRYTSLAVVNNRI